MCSPTSIVLCFTLLNFVVFIQCVSESSAEDSNGILSTESAIRNTVNNLFSTLKLKGMQNKLKLKQYSTIHNFFASITLRDHDNLKKIAKLTEADNIDNGTRVFITQLNEVLNEDNKSDEATDSVYVTFLIEDFINKVDNLKDEHGLKNNTKIFDLNKAIVKYFSNNENNFGNTTYSKEEFVKGNDSDDGVLSENEFWKPSGRRIFEGVLSDIKRFPFMASVQFFRKFQCAGSIIDADLIITSASCLQLAWNNRFFRENPSFLSVQVGSTFYDHGGEHIPVMEIYFHPSFDPKTLRHNLAIMRLTKMLAFGKKHTKVKRIEFDRHPWPLASNADGIIVIGWGVKVLGGTVVVSRKNKLASATLDFYPLEECQEIYSKDFVTDRNFCAGFFSKGGGACNHDAGGPGLSNGLLMGVISFGAPICGTSDAPTVFTKLGYYTDWIEDIMEMEVPTSHKATTLRPMNLPTFGLPPVTPRARMKVMPIVNGKPYKSTPSESNVARTNDEKHEFKEFIKTIFKKKKEQERKGQENQIEESETLEVESVEVTESPPGSEEVTFSSYESSSYETTEVTVSTRAPTTLKHSLHKTKKVKKSKDKTEKVKQKQKFKVKPILRLKPRKATEKHNKPSSNKQKKKSKRKEKVKLSESQSHSIEDSEDVTTIRTTTDYVTATTTVITTQQNSEEIESKKIISSSYSDEEITKSSSQRVDIKEVSTSQDTEIDEAIKSLIEKLDIENILKSQANAKKKDNKSNSKMTTQKVKKLKKEVKDKSSDSNSKSDEERDNGSGEEEGDENGSNEYKNYKQIGSGHKTVTNGYKSAKAEDVNSYITDSRKNEDSEEHKVHKKNKKKHFRTSNKGDTSDEDKTDEDKTALSNTAESSEQETSNSNNTDRLIDMLEYEDIYKLLSGHISDRR